MQKFKRFQFAVGQSYAAICTVGSGDVHVVVPTNAKLKDISPIIMIFKAKINTTNVSLNNF